MDKNTKEIKISTSSLTYTVKLPEQDPNNWVIRHEDSYRPNKDKYILDMFRNQFPDVKVSDVDQMYKVISRSKTATQWLTIANASYVNIVKVPAFAYDLIKPDQMEGIQKELSGINNINKLKGAAIKAAADDFKTKLKSIENDPQYQLPANMSKYAKVLMLNVSDMPLNIQIAIESYTPKDTMSYPQKSDYAREILGSYKRSLISAIDKDPSINIDALIDSSRVK